MTNENERGTFAAHLPCGCQWCELHYGDQAPTSDELEIWKLKNQIVEAVAAEREACAQLADAYDPLDQDSAIHEGIAAAIRARGAK
jgi:hypothetical protein